MKRPLTNHTTQEEFARATAWMARSAGVNWPDPDAAMLEAIGKEETLRREALKAER